MSGICSEHKHYQLGCPRCEADGVMKPEEINRVIAEKVMGWRLREPSYESPQGWWEGSEEEYNLEDWNPAEHIDHAWMVVEVVQKWPKHKQRRFNLAFIDRVDGFDFWQLSRERFCDAICLAALVAVKEK